MVLKNNVHQDVVVESSSDIVEGDLFVLLYLIVLLCLHLIALLHPQNHSCERVQVNGRKTVHIRTAI